MITLIIKGNRKVAGEAAKHRGLPLVHLTETKDPWTVAETPSAFFHRAVKWFSEPPFQAPFHEGALLWYSEAKGKPCGKCGTAVGDDTPDGCRDPACPAAK